MKRLLTLAAGLLLVACEAPTITDIDPPISFARNRSSSR